MQQVCLRPKRDFSVRGHHPWIFSGALANPEAKIASGETVKVMAASGESLGFGSWSPNSQIRVRMLSFDPQIVPDADFVTKRITASVGRRAAFFAGDYTNGIRVVNAESDGMPGLVADCYAGYVICQFTSAGAEFWKPTIVEALMKSVPGCLGVSERTDLKDRIKEGLETQPEFRVLSGAEPPTEIEITEGRCRFLVDVRKGHKTGFYLDQRDARRTIGSLAAGSDVLNCFSYTGGFGLFARAGGAKSVTQVDISGEALAMAKRNEALAEVAGTQMEYVEADVFEYLRKCRDAGRTFDLIVLDPPKFAASKGQVMKAARGYKDINLLAMKLLRPNGRLATFSCSGAMTPELFQQVLADAARDSGRQFQTIAKTGPGADHPVALSFPEGEYLKGVVLQMI